MRNEPAFVYSEKYAVNLGEHVFPVQKYRMVYQRLASEGLISPDNLLVPTFPRKRDLSLVHTPEYLKDLENLTFSPRTAFSEIPLTREIVEAYKLSAGGTILAGADPYRDDQLGQLKLTKAGLKKRDSWIITKCLEKKIPLVILLAGGYAFRVEDTVDIHCHTCRIATTLFGRHFP